MFSAENWIYSRAHFLPDIEETDVKYVILSKKINNGMYEEGHYVRLI